MKKIALGFVALSFSAVCAQSGEAEAFSDSLVPGAAFSDTDAAPFEIPAPPAGAWKKELVAGVVLSSSMFQDWSQGGEDAFSWTARLAGALERTGATWNWANSGKLEFGQTRMGDSPARKSVDELKLESELSRRLGASFRAFGAAALRTQMATGFRYGKDSLGRELSGTAISWLWDPGFLAQSAGLSWVPRDCFHSRLGAAVKETYSDGFRPVGDSLASRGWKIEPGLESVTRLDWKPIKAAWLKSDLSLFTAFDGLEEIDVAWSLDASFEIHRWLSLDAGAQLRRDLQESDRWQWRQTLGLGVTFHLL